jgi:DNA-directed RNA polymerase specialized sigma24 family protein
MVTATERRSSDEHLGELTAKGDVEAFSALYDRHFQGVYDLALRVVRDPELAAEAACEGFVRSWTVLRKRPVRDVKASLYASAFRVAVDRAPKRIASSEAANFTGLETRRLADPTAVLQDPELVRLVWESASALTPRDYGLLDLQLRKGIGPKELAQALGVKRATLDARLARLKEQFARSVADGWSDGRPPRVSPLAVFAALAPLAVPPGLQAAVWHRVLEQTRAPSRRGWRPSRSTLVIAGAVLVAAAAGGVVALLIAAGPDDPSGFRSATHQIGAETSDTAIAIQWTPKADATGYSILWSHERALPDETVDLPGTAAQARRVVTPGQWWFNLRTRDGSGDWTHTVHIGPYVVVAVPDTKIASRPDALSNDPRPVFRLEATGPGTFECAVDGARFEPCDARTEIGRLRDGRHRFQARIRDRYGNADALPAVWVWRVDTASPRTRIVSAEPDRREATFRFASSQRKSTFECRIDKGDFRRCRSPLSVEGLRQGKHVFFVRATDSAGNVDRSAAVYRWEVDTRAPRTKIVSGPSGTVRRARATFVLDANEDEVTYECSVDGRAFEACSSTVTLTDLKAGEHTFAARATDEAGNVDRTPARRRWTVVDASTPDTTITEHPGANSNDASPTFRFRSSESGSRFECRLDHGSWRACSSPKTYTGLVNGQHVFRVRARDEAGNVDRTPASWTWTIH